MMKLNYVTTEINKTLRFLRPEILLPSRNSCSQFFAYLISCGLCVFAFEHIKQKRNLSNTKSHHDNFTVRSNGSGEPFQLPFLLRVLCVSARQRSSREARAVCEIRCRNLSARLD